ncbi:MAG: GNAT family N-acetyltransferase [Candidatus Delongbacteria bacterium]
MPIDTADIRIRRACPDDAKILSLIIREAMIKYAGVSNIPGTLPSLTETVEDIGKYITEDTVLIAIISDEAVGTIRIRQVSQTEAEISRFAVLPEYQKSGLGAAIFSAAEDILKKARYESVFLHTSLDNRNLLNFYISRSFTVESESFSQGYRRGLLRKTVNLIFKTV